MTWDLSKLYAGFDAPEFLNDVEALKKDTDAVLGQARVMELTVPALEEAIRALEKLTELYGKTMSFTYLTLAADANCEPAMQAYARLLPYAKRMEEVNSAAVGGPSGGAFGEGKQEDDLMAEAVRVVIEAGQASTSLLQRRLRVGYARGSRLLDMMEQAGYVSVQDGSKPRRVLIKRSQYEEIFGVALPPPDSQGNGDA